MIARLGSTFYLLQRRRDPSRPRAILERVPSLVILLGNDMLFWISMIVTALVAVAAATLLGFSLAETGRLHLGAFAILWAVVGMLVPLWLIFRHGRK